MSAELKRILSEENLFKILGLDLSASTEDVRKAYKTIMRQVHPDRFQDPAQRERAEMAFKRVGLAFETLKDPLSRRDYERTLDKNSFARSTPPGSTPRPATDPPPRKAPTSPLRPDKKPPPRPEGQAASSAQTKPFNDNEKQQKIREEQAEKHYQQGRAFETKNEMDEAIREYKEAIRLCNPVGRYHSRLGLALEKKGWAGYAQAEFKVALHFDPTDALALKHYQPTQGKNTRQGFKLLSFFKGNKSQRLGDILIKLGYLDKSQLQETLKAQQDENLLLGELLIRKKFVKPEQLAQALIHQAEILEQQDDKK